MMNITPRRLHEIDAFSSPQPTIPSQQSQHPNVFGISHPSTGRFSFSTIPLSWVHFAVDDLTTQALSNGGSHDPFIGSRGISWHGKKEKTQSEPGKKKGQHFMSCFQKATKDLPMQKSLWISNIEKMISPRKPTKMRQKNLGLTTCLQPKCAMDFFKALSVAVSTKSSNRSIAAVKSSPWDSTATVSTWKVFF